MFSSLSSLFSAAYWPGSGICADYLQWKTQSLKKKKAEEKEEDEDSTDSGADLIDYYRWGSSPLLLLLTAAAVVVVVVCCKAVGRRRTWQGRKGHERRFNIYRLLVGRGRKQQAALYRGHFRLSLSLSITWHYSSMNLDDNECEEEEED